jgi:hypothetical protein
MFSVPSIFCDDSISITMEQNQRHLLRAFPLTPQGCRDLRPINFVIKLWVMQRMHKALLNGDYSILVVQQRTVYVAQDVS